MPQKQFMLLKDLPITVYKRRGNRNLRLSLSPTGDVRVSIPAWAPYSAGVNFAKSRQEWILAQRSPLDLLLNGQAVGKAHHLHFISTATALKVTTRIKESEIIITIPTDMPIAASTVQLAAREASIRALRAQAQLLLPQRLAVLAAQYDFSYGTVSIKQMKGRWGSCDQHKNIVLNLFLMQLPWESIDYVLLHELVHTRVMKHGPPFWKAMEAVLKDAKSQRKLLHSYRPVLIGSSTMA